MDPQVHILFFEEKRLNLKHFQCECGKLSLRVANENLAKGAICDDCRTPLSLMVTHNIVVNRTPAQIPLIYFSTNGKMPFKI